MNNNRSNNNNRRRGRGGNRPQGGNQGNQLNRIDSRARGNAPQLLEKFKKMAQDASLNGDRVQAEYYLQFADHYFRVLADSKARLDEQRAKRDEERGPPGNSGQDGEGDNDGERNARRGAPRNDRNDRNEQSNEDPRFADDDNNGDNSYDDSDDDASRGDSRGEPSENPFTRRTPRARAPGSRKPAPRNRDNDAPPENSAEEGLDPTSLPPAIGVSDGDKEKPAPRKRVRRTRPVADDGGEPLEKAS